MTDKKNPRKDFTQVAFGVFQQAIGEVEPPKPLAGKKADSRKGGLKGGKARMESLTEEERVELATRAARARWGDAAPAQKTGAAKPRSTKQR